MRVLSILTTLLLLAIAVPNAGAVAIDPVGTVESITPLVGEYVTVDDTDGDGQKEVAAGAATPACGCNCPGVYGGVAVEAVGQGVFVGGFTALCQHAGDVSVDPNTVDVGAGVHVVPTYGTFGPVPALPFVADLS